MRWVHNGCFLLILNGAAPGLVCVCHCEASVQQTRNKRRELLHSTRPGCNPSTRIMNPVCVCVCVCVYFLMMAMGLCVPQKWLGECFQLSDMSWRSEVKRHSLTPTHTLSAAQHSLTRVCCHQESSLIKSSSLSNTHTHTHTLTACRLSPYPRVSWGDHVCISVCICVCVCVCVCVYHSAAVWQFLLLCQRAVSCCEGPARWFVSLNSALCDKSVCVCIFANNEAQGTFYFNWSQQRKLCLQVQKKNKTTTKKKQVCK